MARHDFFKLVRGGEKIRLPDSNRSPYNLRFHLQFDYQHIIFIKLLKLSILLAKPLMQHIDNFHDLGDNSKTKFWKNCVTQM